MAVRQALVCLLIASLAFPFPAWSNPGIVGTAASSRSATVQGNALPAGSTVFSGDTIDVGHNGNLSIAVNGGVQVRVGPQSQVRLAREDNKALLEIGRGSASFRIPEPATFEARFADATIRGAGNSPAVGVILFRDAKNVLIAAEKGELVVRTAHDAKSVTLREGEGVEVALAPAPPPQAGTTTATTLPGRWVAVLGIIFGGALIAVAIYLNNRGGLSDREKRDAVSPFRFP
jgi:hypothetical protein